MSSQIDLLKTTLAALGMHYTSATIFDGEWTIVEVDDNQSDTVQFTFKNGVFDGIETLTSRGLAGRYDD